MTAGVAASSLDTVSVLYVTWRRVGECSFRRESGTGNLNLGGLVFKAHRLLYQPALGLRVIKKKKHLNLRSF